MLRRIAHRPHPCAPWLDLPDSVRQELFPGGIGASPTALAARLAHLGTRTFAPVELPESCLAPLAPATRTALEKALSGTFPVVLTGQQPVLGGGPMFVWLKAAGAIAQARRASRILGREVVPLFWIAGDDSDLAEVRSVRDPLTGQELSVDLGEVPSGRSVGDLRWDDAEGARLRQELSRWWPGTGLPATFGSCRTLSELTRACLEAWFPEAGLAVVDAAWPGLRTAFAPAYADFARHGALLSEDIASGIGSAKAAGLHVSLRDLPGKLRLFSWRDGIRSRLEAPPDPEGLSRQILSNPEGFTHDAASRIFAAEAAFPVLAHILGPGEFAYVACLGAAQERLDRPFGIALPRPSLTLLPSGQADLARGLGVALDGKCPSHPRALEDLWLGREHPELEALRTRWIQARELYLETVADGAATGPGARLERWEARELRKRKEAIVRRSPETRAALRLLWSWMGAGALQERNWPAWSLFQNMGHPIPEELMAILPELPEDLHHVLESA